MKQIVLKAIISVLIVFAINTSYAQVRIYGSVGNPNIRVLSTIKSAFDSINNGKFNGDIQIEIIGNTTESVPATLLDSGSGAANYSSVNIKPVGGSFTISSNTANLILLNGSSNVNIDGVMHNGDSLKFVNTLSSTINIINGANNISVKNCIMKASAEYALGINVSYSGAKCYNVTISNCDIGPSTGILKNGIQCQPSVNNLNSNINIYKNRIFDVQLSAINLSKVIHSSIVANRIYNTKTYLHNSSVVGGYNIKSIVISEGYGFTIDSNIIGYENAQGNGIMKILANSVDIAGFPSAYTPTGTARSISYTAIECSFTKDSAISSINANIISNIALYTGRNNTSNTKAFYGIRVLAGMVGIGDVSGNIIGSENSKGSIYVATSAVNTTACAISLVTENYSVLANNKIGGIDVSGTINGSSGSFVGIFIQRQNSVYKKQIFISNNTVGNELADNIRIGVLKNANLTFFSNIGSSFVPSGTLGFAYGIHDRSSEEVVIGEKNKQNTVRNITLSVANANSSLAVRLVGIFAESIVNKISHNEIYNLKTNGNNLSISSTNVSAAGIIVESINGGDINREISHNAIHDIYSTYPNEVIANVGIGAKGTGNFIVQNNKIYNLFISPAVNIKSYLIGMYFPATLDNVLIINNMITLGVAQNINANIAGIWSGSSPSFNIYNNSVYIGGSSKNGYSICYQKTLLNLDRVTIVNIYNNIFINNRNSPDSVDNYAITNNYKTTSQNVARGWEEQFSNNNFYYSKNKSKVAYWNGDRSFKGWVSVSNCDSQSISTVIPNFVDTLNGDLNIIVDSLSYTLESAGKKLLSNQYDFYGNSRINPINTINNQGYSFDIGAVEFDGKSLDVAGPTIVYTHAKYQVSTKKLRIDSVYIFDKSGVNNNIGSKPRLYFKKDTDADTFVSNSPTDIGWKYVEAINNSSPYSFNPDFNLLFGDTPKNKTYIQYFIIAQDESPAKNVSLMRARPTVAPSTVNLQAVNFPMLDFINTVRICITCKELQGDYYIGGGLNYAGINTDYSSINDFLNDFEPGIVRRIRIINKGSGYSQRPSININGGGGSGAIALAILDQDSSVKEVVIMNPGSGYTSKPTISVTRVGPTGAGLVLDVDISNGAIFTGPTNLLLSESYNNNRDIDIYTGNSTSDGIKFTSLKEYGISQKNNLTIKPAPNTSHVFKNYSMFYPLIMFKHAEHITIDGSNNNSDSRDITFKSQTTGNVGCILMAHSSIYDLGNSFITIKNCRIMRDTIFNGMQPIIGISIAGSDKTSTSVGYYNDNISIINNEIYGCDFPIYLSGNTFRNDVNNVVKGNYLYHNIFPNKTVGIFAAFQDNLLIEGNYIAGMRSNTYNIGISLGGRNFELGFSDRIQTGSARISKNIIIDNLSSNTASSAAIFANKNIGEGITIDNNLIYQKENVNSTKSTVGIFLFGNENSQFNVYHNTVFLDGVKSSTAPLNETSYNLAISNHCKLDIKNNVFFNNTKSTSNNKTVNIGLGFYNQKDGYSSLNSDYNLYYKSDSNASLAYPYLLNSVGGIFANSLAEYKTLTNQDQHSVMKNVDFKMMGGIPRIDNTLACEINDGIPTLPNFNTDVFNNYRNAALTRYGAEEYNFDIPVGYFLNEDSCNTQYISLSGGNFVGDTTGLTIGYYEDSLATILVNRPDSVTVSKTYYIKISNNKCGKIIPVNVTTHTPVTASIKILKDTSCTTETYNSITITGDTTGRFLCETELHIDENTGIINPSLSTVGYHIVLYIYKATPLCSKIATDTILIIKNVKAEIISNTGFSFCEGDSLKLIASEHNSYLWSTGQTTQSIVVHTPGVYTLITSNEICIDSTSVVVQHFPKATIEIVAQNDTLFTDKNYSNYSWYRNSVLIPSANTYFIVPKLSGTYKVYAADSNSCELKSEDFAYTYNFVSTDVKALLQIYPNPASKEIKIVGKEFYSSIRIINLYGALVKEFANSKISTINIEELPSGLYFITADEYVGKFFKE